MSRPDPRDFPKEALARFIEERHGAAAIEGLRRMERLLNRQALRRRIRAARRERRACDVTTAEGARRARRLTAELDVLHERLGALREE